MTVVSPGFRDKETDGHACGTLLGDTAETVTPSGVERPGVLG